MSNKQEIDRIEKLLISCHYEIYCVGRDNRTESHLDCKLAAKEIQKMILETLIKELEQYLLSEEYHNKDNTDSNMWSEHIFTKNRIQELNQQLSALKDKRDE